MKNTKTKINQHSFNSRLDSSGEEISDLENRWKDPEWSNKRKKRKFHKNLYSYTVGISNVVVISVSETEKGKSLYLKIFFWNWWNAVNCRYEKYKSQASKYAHISFNKTPEN